MRELHIRLAALEQKVEALEKEAGLKDFVKDLFGGFDLKQVIQKTYEELEKQTDYDWVIHNKDIHGFKGDHDLVLQFTVNHSGYNPHMTIPPDSFNVAINSKKHNIFSTHYSTDHKSKDLALEIVKDVKPFLMAGKTTKSRPF